ncbi:heparinase [Clostridium sp. MCC353]|uniref:heparinase II/III family protein n=1 Tax=Clostridium sp. MCC353 TaxID=2592646 RepID=UPI001C028549|nr:heparinase II/III family protein [Clostridium sp. MCC353]MBT9776123.1 heparinase [Clostridium sp. MCC353]
MYKAYFNNPNNFISSGQMSWCGDYCKTHWPEEVRHILRIADDAVNHTFLFDLRWDMERTYEPVHFDGPVKWDYQPGDDPEFIFQFNRHQFFICLGQAYALTGNEKYAEAFAKLLESWIKENPLTDHSRETTWRSIEAGIRAETWVKAMAYFKDSPVVTEELMELYVNCLTDHARYLMGSYKYFQIKSNWGVIESRGLLEIGLALSDALEISKTGETKTWIETAISRLDEGLRVQIMDDGVQWEQSPMYHNEVFHCSIEALRLAKRYGFSMPETFVHKAHQMARVNLAWKKPNHCQPAQGDSDETDLRDLLAQSAYLFGDPVLKYAAYEHLDFDGIWDYLEDGVKAYEAMEPQKPDFLLKDLNSSGNFYLRSGWNEDDDFFHFRCGSLGGGHGHSDKLHIDLVLGGEDILMDAGRYHYVGGPIRYELKNALSHNTPTVDSRDYLTCLDSWGVSGLSPAYRQPYCQKGEFTLVQGGHGGYLQEGLGDVYINRRVLAVGTGVYIIADTFYGSTEHVYQQNYHFNPDGTVELSEQKNSAHYTGRNAEADFIFDINTEWDAAVTSTRISRNYNQMESNRTITLSRKKNGCCTLVTVIAGGKKGSYAKPQVTRLDVTSPARGITLPEEDAHGLRITFNGQTYVVIIGHKDIAGANEMLCADGYMGLGTVLVFKPGEPKTGGTVLCW